MSQERSAETATAALNRRRFLKTTGVVVAGASLGDMLLARQAPAQTKGTTLRCISASHFVPAYDAWLDDFVKKWGEKNGVKASIDHIPGLEQPSRYAAEFAAGAGHDLIQFNGLILTGHYYQNLVDLTDMATSMEKKYGKWMEKATSAAAVNGRWYAIPDYFIAIPVLWRKDLFDSVGLGEPKTWEDLRKAARLLKPKGHPTGMQFSHCNDANHNWRALLYSFGAKETDPSGKVPALDSKETREALKFAKALFDEGMTPEVYSWDDASDNRYLASGVACWIHDAISAYRTTQDTNPKVWQSTYLVPEVSGPGGRWNVGEPTIWSIWKFSKNPTAAKELLQALKDAQKEAMGASRGYNMPFNANHYSNAMPGLADDPKLSVLQEQPKITAFFGNPGPMTPAAQEVLTTFIVPDMFTKVARGGNVDDAVKWAMGEINRIYAKHKGA
jgi:multiple sugar transport system substrate-binding protein